MFATFWQGLLIMSLSFLGVINWESLQRAIVANRNASLLASAAAAAEAAGGVALVDVGDPCVDDWGNYLCLLDPDPLGLAMPPAPPVVS